MLIGHYGPALLASLDRRAPDLGPLFIGCQLVDIAFSAFTLMGIEHFRIVPGITAMSPLDLHDLPWTHSLLATLGWAALFGLILWRMTGRRAAGLIGGAVVLSHWPLDLLVHRPDLTLDGGPPYLGLGLWNHPAVEIPLELGLAFGALALFAWRSAGKRLPLALLCLLMLLVVAMALFGPAPDPGMSHAVIAWSGLAIYGLLALAAGWTGRTRSPSR
jgi:hypothetical protein